MTPEKARHLRDKHTDFDDGVVVVECAMGGQSAQYCAQLCVPMCNIPERPTSR